MVRCGDAASRAASTTPWLCAMTSASPPSFYRDELSRALAEQGDAIGSYHLTDSNASSASAEVQLLEGIAITVTLSIRGYQVPAQGQSTTYESLEPLLESVSQLYGEKKNEALFAKLNALAQA